MDTVLRTPVDGTRLRILAWLKEPGVAERGATVDAVATRFALPHAVARTHLRLLAAAGLLRTGHVAGRPHYRRDEVRIAEVARMFEKGW
ncbi:helix-turn-helix domain-containing protein [Streptomyces viridosporus]|uniref:helix-turn-helix domain-containing protein n=1 Tax=Streptomyces viridosporus TaxID=67581 RepID=UPI0009BE5254|nr:helix-turn-helix domain-containing protein [Streptomyces viridosporus]